MASYKEFVELVDQLLRDIDLKSTRHGSREWYLRNHVYHLSENCHNSESAIEVRNSIASLVRFASESLDWNSELSKRVIQISEYHSSLIKAKL